MDISAVGGIPFTPSVTKASLLRKTTSLLKMVLSVIV